MTSRVLTLLTLLGGLLFAQPAAAQYSRVVAQRNNVSDSFYERIGVGFGFNLRGANRLPGDDGGRSAVVGLLPNGQLAPGGAIPFRGGGGFGAALPPFGGHVAGRDPGLGIGFRGKGGSGFLNFAFGQGSNRSNSSDAVSLTVPNGGTGFISDTRQVPFVTGLIPVVGGFAPIVPAWPTPAPMRTSPLRERLDRMKAGELKQAASRQAPPAADVDDGDAGGILADAAPAEQPIRLGAVGSSAETGDLSVAEIRRRQAAGDEAVEQEVLALIERARGAEAAGKANVASIYYKMASRRASGELQQQLEAKAASLKP